MLTAPLRGSASCWAGGLGAGECPWLQPWSPPTSDEGAQGLHRAVSGHQTPPECPGACRAPAGCCPPGPDPHAHQHGGEGRQGWGEWGGGCGATGAGCASVPLPTGSFGVPGLRAHPELPGGCPALLGSWLNPTACLEPHPSWGLALWGCWGALGGRGPAVGRDGVGRTLNLLQDLTPGSVEEAEEAEPDEEFKDAIEVWAWRGAGWPYRVAERGRGLLGGSRVGAGEGRSTSQPGSSCTACPFVPCCGEGEPAAGPGE